MCLSTRLRWLLAYRIPHTIICFPRRGTYNLHTAPTVPSRFSISWEPPLFARLGLTPFPKPNTPLTFDSVTLPGGVSHSTIHRNLLTSLQHCQPILLNDRLCMEIPLLAMVVKPPFTALRRLILPCEVFQLSIRPALTGYLNRY